MYFPYAQEFVFLTSYYGNRPIPLMIFDNDFFLKESGDFSVNENVYTMFTASAFYNEETLFLIYDNNYDLYINFGEKNGLNEVTEEVETTSTNTPTTNTPVASGSRVPV